MPVRFLKNASEIADVSWESPLPVMETLRERKLVQVDTLLLHTTSITTTQRDLHGNIASSNPDLPTLDNCLKYHTLIWTGYKAGADNVNYVVQARCGDSLDPNSGGDPLGSGWLDITAHTTAYNTNGAVGTAGTIAGAAGHFRVVISLPDGLYFDQYRILVYRTTGSDFLMHNKIVGVRR